MTYNARQYARALHDLVSESTPASSKKTVQSFANFLKKNNALHLSDEIFRSFNELSKEKEGVKEVSIITATEESAKKFRGKFDKESEVKIVVDPKILGGASVTIDDIRVDNSVKGRLSELKRVFTN